MKKKDHRFKPHLGNLAGACLKIKNKMGGCEDVNSVKEHSYVWSSMKEEKRKRERRREKKRKKNSKREERREREGKMGGRIDSFDFLSCCFYLCGISLMVINHNT